MTAVRTAVDAVRSEKGWMQSLVPPAPVRDLLRIGIGAGVVFAGLSIAVWRQARPVASLDGDLHMWIVLERTDLDSTIARALTWGGSTFFTVPALLVVGALAPQGPRRFVSRLGSGLVLAGVGALGMYVGLTINALVNGVRPGEVDWTGDAGGPTYPSGHTTTATIFAACCVWALAHRMHTRRSLAILCAAGATWAAVVGLTRIWLGVHWPSDVVGGWLYGTAWTCLAAAALVTLADRRWRGASGRD